MQHFVTVLKFLTVLIFLSRLILWHVNALIRQLYHFSKHPLQNTS